MYRRIMNIIKVPEDYYVYVHYLENKAVYVGKGSGYRVLDKHKRTHTWDGYLILEQGLTEEEAFRMEKVYQDELGLPNRRNPGWDNLNPYNRRGGKMHENTREALAKCESPRNKGMYNPCLLYTSPSPRDS